MEKNQTVPDIRALVAFGKAGMAMMAYRMLSLVALVGILAISAYSVYVSSVIGAGCVAILSVFVFIPSLRAESRREQEQEA